MLEIVSVGAEEAWRYAPFVPQRYRQRLLSGGGSPDLLLTGVAVLGEPRGAALGRLFPRGEALCESVYVVPPLRGQGFGRALVATLERDLAELGARRVSAFLLSVGAGGEAAHRLVRGLGWSEPELTRRRYDFGPGAATDRSLTRRPLGSYELVAVAELAGARRAALAAQAAKLPAGLDPLRDPDILVSEASFALFRDGAVAGWSVAHRENPRSLSLSSLWILSELRKQAPLGTMLGATVRGAFTTGIDYLRAFIDYGNRPMERVIERHFQRYLVTDVVDLYETGRSLS